MTRKLSEIVVEEDGTIFDHRTGARIKASVFPLGRPRYISTNMPGCYDLIVEGAPPKATAFCVGDVERIAGFKLIPIQYYRETDK